jgi:phosphoribosylamine--glycine ligase
LKIAVIGGGGREHAIIKKLKENKAIETIYALPGNGGIAQDAVCAPVRATDIKAVTQFAREKALNFVAVIPDDPLCLGLVDALEEAGIRAFGPNKKAAIIEGSKVFSKKLMRKYDIPTADYAAFDDAGEAIAYLETADMPIVIKADGLALGKGVIIAGTREEARDAVHSMMNEGLFGMSGSRVVLETFLEGPEVTVLAFTDGKTIKPMVSSMDHKRALDNDEGLNTGGMGTIAPNPFYTKEIAERCMREIYIPTIEAMNKEGRTFRGCLYFGLILTKDGPKVIEYNCRFGDPETQVVIPLLKSDLLDIMQATIDGTLDKTDVAFSDDAACCVVIASGGYPKQYETGYPISGLDAAGEMATVYHAGTKASTDGIVTNGGRVLGVTAVAQSLDKAVTKAYEAANQIAFENAHMRKDIGRKALAK